MELIEATLSPVERRTGAARVLWTDLVTQQQRRGDRVRVLAPGERVVLCLDGLTYHAGEVLTYLGEGSEGSYVVTVGSPIGRREAQRRTGRTAAQGFEKNREPRVVDAVAIPVQRTGRVELFL